MRSRTSTAPIVGIRVAADADVALDDRVPQSHLDRVEAELSRQLVEERLERERGRRRAGRAVGAEREAVRLHAVAADLVSLPAVRAGDEQGGDPLDSPAGVRAAVDDHAPLDRRERAVLARADLEVRDLRRGGVRRLEVLAARERQPHGPARARAPRPRRAARRARTCRRTRRRAARRSTRIRSSGRSNARASSLRVTNEPCVLVETTSDAGRLEPGGADLRLDVRLVDPGRAERPLDDGVAGGERRGDVAVLARDPVEHVPRELLLRVVGLPVVDWRLVTCWIDSRSPPSSSVSSTMRASAAPGSIAASTSTTASSGS